MTQNEKKTARTSRDSLPQEKEQQKIKILQSSNPSAGGTRGELQKRKERGQCAVSSTFFVSRGAYRPRPSITGLGRRSSRIRITEYAFTFVLILLWGNLTFHRSDTPDRGTLYSICKQPGADSCRGTRYWHLVCPFTSGYIYPILDRPTPRCTEPHISPRSYPRLFSVSYPMRSLTTVH